MVREDTCIARKELVYNWLSTNRRAMKITVFGRARYWIRSVNGENIGVRYQTIITYRDEARECKKSVEDNVVFV